MIVTVWHLNPRERYRQFDDVDRVDYHAAPDRIELYSKTDLIAQFGPGYCWAIESRRETT